MIKDNKNIACYSSQPITSFLLKIPDPDLVENTPKQQCLRHVGRCGHAMILGAIHLKK